MQPVAEWIDAFCRVKDAVTPSGYRPKKGNSRKTQQKKLRRKWVEQFFL